LEFGMPREREPAVITLGTFDGVHLGHQRVLRRTVEMAQSQGAQARAVTFDPHPRCVVDPDRCPILLTTVDERADVMDTLGVDGLTVLTFDRALAATPAEAFAEELLQRFDVRGMVVGPDYAFGNGRRGNAELLRRYGAQSGFAVEEVTAVETSGETVSSSRIRRLVADGEMQEASRLLGHEFFINSYVEHGAGRGTRIGYPTANVAITPNKALPRRGVYAVRVTVGGAEHGGALNIGYRPTFSGDKMTVEVFIFDFAGDIYRQMLRIDFVERMRDEMRFATVEDLVLQIDRDVEQARRILERD
jgi:riboflavin kinase/FMN adenylyltransferase